MKNIYKNIFSLFIIGFFLLLAFGSGESGEKVKIDINDQQAIEKYIQGKWSWEKHTGDVNHTWRYRFEISGNKLKIWSCLNNSDDPFDMSGGYEEFNFTLGSPTRDVDGYKARYLEFAVFDKTNFFGLTYEGLSPFWLVSDDNWDTPVLRCGSGIPSWSREEFQATGNKISHSESNSNTESDYSTSNTYNEEDNQTITNTEEQNSEEENNTNSQTELSNQEENIAYKLASTVIGNQVWTTQNLDIDKFSNGDVIPQAKNEKEWVEYFNKKQPCWCYFSFDSNNKKYGKIYNWYTVFDPRGLAPYGWQIPKQEDWNNLISYLGGKDFAGKKIKSKNGFKAVLAGTLEYQSHWNEVSNIIDRTNWWSSDITDNYYIKGNSTLHQMTQGRLVFEDADYLTTDGIGEGDGSYVRLIKK